ncbi:uncharacterized protein PFL1_00098 [Pseudozyma flocculosa PF-1]|uniref:Probable Alcohol dehydrogenase n=1 Tax=Pseudozyma flocculosa TaxID=84751 RepID=A0A5C3ETM9_9BASI|nr:uncharacterized protein PFL1_00098 [Pseudozyma flocculosa PF-1]EPQ31899.1 hypothetical protein PFL1_00098 [Pseudozyma flocculosa PF-1]SPO35190.1 probable Alcohol dehydrogenase [Pseudozyma flocculosa]
MASTTNQVWTLPRPSERKSFDDLKLKERPMPKPAPTQVLIKVHAVSLNYRDLIIAQGQYPLEQKDDELIPASDGAGEIVDVGERVKAEGRWKAGDRVMGIFTQKHLSGSTARAADLSSTLGGGVDGMLAQYVVLEEYGIVRIPSHLSYEQAATLPCAAVTAYNALYGIPSHQLRAGDTVVAQGTGGVSVFALQLAVAAGAQTVITSSSDDKLRKVVSLVPEPLRHLVHTFNYKSDPHWDKKVLEVTGGLGADHIVEVGGPGTLEKSFQSVKQGSVISTIGFVAKGDGEPVNVALHALVKGAIFRGLLVGSRDQFEHMNAILELHRIVPAVDRVFDYHDAAKAYQHQWSQAHVGKVVIRVAA